MKHSRKMVLISEEKYKSLSNSKQPESEQVEVHSHAANTDGAEKSRDPQSEKEVKDRLSVEIILTAVPKPYRNKARSMLSHISAHPNQLIDWNEKGEILISGELISNSHISDLLKDSMRPTRDFTPVGADKFYKALSEMGIPRSLIGNGVRRDNLGQKITDNTTAPSLDQNRPHPPGIPALIKKKMNSDSTKKKKQLNPIGKAKTNKKPVWLKFY